MLSEVNDGLARFLNVLGTAENDGPPPLAPEDMTGAPTVEGQRLVAEVYVESTSLRVRLLDEPRVPTLLVALVAREEDAFARRCCLTGSEERRLIWATTESALPPTAVCIDGDGES